MQILPKFNKQGRAEQRRAQLYSNLLHEEAKMGGQLFGPVPAGHRREFFNLDRRTWVWHEEWIDSSGQRQIVTTRYDIRPNGILKSQGNNSYQRLDAAELKNLYKAARLYRDKVWLNYQRALNS